MNWCSISVSCTVYIGELQSVRVTVSVVLQLQL